MLSRSFLLSPSSLGRMHGHGTDMPMFFVSRVRFFYLFSNANSVSLLLRPSFILVLSLPLCPHVYRGRGWLLWFLPRWLLLHVRYVRGRVHGILLPRSFHRYGSGLRSVRCILCVRVLSLASLHLHTPVKVRRRGVPSRSRCVP